MARAAEAATRQAAQAAGQAIEAGRQASRPVLAPLRAASRSVFLEVTGAFFALFALSFAAAAWKLYAEGDHGRRPVLLACAAAAFVWFSAGNFLRANRKR